MGKMWTRKKGVVKDLQNQVGVVIVHEPFRRLARFVHPRFLAIFQPVASLEHSDTGFSDIEVQCVRACVCGCLNQHYSKSILIQWLVGTYNIVIKN